MNFTLPETQEQMYSSLQTIFNFYRVQRAQPFSITLPAISLPRIPVTQMTDSQLNDVAEILINAEHEEFLAKKRESVQEKIREYTEMLNAFPTQKEVDEQKIIDSYNLSRQKIVNTSIKNGLANTSVELSKLAELEENKNKKIIELTEKYTEKETLYNAKIASLTTTLNDLQNRYENYYNMKKIQKIQELKDKEEQNIIELKKYNCSLEEKEKRYVNYVTLTKANLKLRQTEINSTPLTKEDLINLGYYEDVMKCVCYYYDKFSPVNAYQLIARDVKVIQYLDDFYAQVLRLYEARIDLNS